MYLKRVIKLKLLTKICVISSSIRSLFLPNSLQDISYYKTYDLLIPTYEHSGQAVHPDIVCGVPHSPVFVMAFTPYPFSVDAYENPSIVVSDDGLHFRVEDKTVNPIVSQPFKDHNDDPDMFFRDGKWKILYLETLRPETQNIRLLQSENRKDWTNTILKSTDLQGGRDPFVLSPACISDDSKTFIFYVNMNYQGHRIEYVTTGEKLSSNFSDWTPVDIDMRGLHPWHVDIIKGQNRYYMLISVVSKDKSNKNRYSLYIATSSDLLKWHLSEKKVLANSYRSTGFISGDDMYVYYSRQSGFFSPWKIGIYKIKLSDFFGDI